ncbi:MAG: tyrosine-type recombinase/integrase [Acidimicrobiales bacterium]
MVPAPGSRRRFGRLRKLPSGRYQAGYVGADGQVRTAEQTFATKGAAERWLTLTEARLLQGTWIAPERRQETVGQWAERWIASRTGLAVRTIELYRWLLDRHILPDLSEIPLGDVSPEDVRTWYVGIASKHPTTAAKAYRLLSSMMRAAVGDGTLTLSPCRLPGAGRETAPTRPIATIDEVVALVDAMPGHLQIVVLLAAWCQLRRGEILGLQWGDVDLQHAVLRVVRTRTTMMNGGVAVKVPKTSAGRRTVSIPPHVVPLIANHLAWCASTAPDSWVVVGEQGGPIQPTYLQTVWNRARVAIGRPELHLHDLRHTGLTWAAMTGATTAELMHRAGHSSPAAAQRYQHATEERDKALASALTAIAESRT